MKPTALVRSRRRPRREEPVGGRDKLIDAVVHLGAGARSIASLGLREIARQAGLNPNTFYRHFKDFDELGLAVIDKLSTQLRADLRARREGPGPSDSRSLQRVVHDSVDLAFDFILDHRAAYVIAIRELHGSSPVLRKALRRVLDHIADEMTEDAMRLIRVPELTRETVHELSHLIIRQISVLGLEYLEQPEPLGTPPERVSLGHPAKRAEDAERPRRAEGSLAQRERRAAIRRQAERFILLLFWGALAAHAPHTLANIDVDLPEA